MLETLSDQQVVELMDTIRWYAELNSHTKRSMSGMDEDRQSLVLKEDQRHAIFDMLDFRGRLTPEARQFLVSADTKTFELLRTMRKDEVRKLEELLKLDPIHIRRMVGWMQSGGTLSRFFTLLFVVGIGAFLSMIAAGQQILSWIDAVRGMHK